MYYIIQENIFKERNFNLLINVLDRHKMDYEIVKWRPFAEEIEFKTDRKDVFCFGCVNLTKVAHKYNWKPGVYFNDGHDMEVYFRHYGEHMLNSDGTFINYGDELPEYLPDYFFARPSKDSKVFSGGLFTKSSWKKWVETPVSADVIESILSPETRIFVAPAKNGIQKEIRCWIVDGKVITISLYKLGSKGFQQNYDHEEEAINYAQKIANIFSPSRAFVLDICLHNGEYKVVEINCMNCSGYYDSNMNKLIQALESM